MGLRFQSRNPIVRTKVQNQKPYCEDNVPEVHVETKMLTHKSSSEDKGEEAGIHYRLQISP